MGGVGVTSIRRRSPEEVAQAQMDAVQKLKKKPPAKLKPLTAMITGEGQGEEDENSPAYSY